MSTQYGAGKGITKSSRFNFRQQGDFPGKDQTLSAPSPVQIRPSRVSFRTASCSSQNLEQ
jgi:hypothetical protein